MDRNLFQGMQSKRGTEQNLLRLVIRNVLLPPDTNAVSYNIANELAAQCSPQEALELLSDTARLRTKLTAAYDRLNIPYFIRNNNSEKTRLTGIALSEIDWFDVL